MRVAEDSTDEAEDAAADPEDAAAEEIELAAAEAVEEAEPDSPNKEAPFTPTIPPDTELPATDRPAFVAAEL